MINWLLVFSYLGFLLGEFVFLLKRAQLVTSADPNPLHTVWAFVVRNVITILTRWFIAFFIWYACEKFGFTAVFGLFGWHLPFNINPGVVPFMALGFVSDSLIDWFFAQKFIPAFFKDKLAPSDFQQMNVPKDKVDEVKLVAPEATVVQKSSTESGK